MEMNAGKTKVMRISRRLSPVRIIIDKKQPENLEYLKYLGSMITNDSRCAREMKFMISMATAAFNNTFISNLAYIEGRNL
jgi:hypothetical protein